MPCVLDQVFLSQIAGHFPVDRPVGLCQNTFHDIATDLRFGWISAGVCLHPGQKRSPNGLAMKISAGCLLPLLISLAVFYSGAADWPQWGGRNARNFVSHETNLPTIFRPERKTVANGITTPIPAINLKWTAPLGTLSYVTPAISQGRIYVGANDARGDTSRFKKTRGGVLDCLDEATGKRLWRLVIPRLITKNKLFNYDNLNLGLCSSPTVDGNRVYIVGNRCDVLCLDINGQADGNAGPFTDEGHYMCDNRKFPDKPGRFDAAEEPPLKSPVLLQPGDADIVWRYDLLTALDIWPQDAADCSILVHGNVLFICTSNGVDSSHKHIPSPNAPNLIALDKRTGKLLAVIDQPLGTAVFHGDWSSPTLARINGQDQIIWGGGDGICYAFDANFEPGSGNQPGILKKIWWFDCNPPDYKTRNGKPLPYSKGGKGRIHPPYISGYTKGNPRRSHIGRRRQRGRRILNKS